MAIVDFERRGPIALNRPEVRNATVAEPRPVFCSGKFRPA
jgi:hypothetical protein